MEPSESADTIGIGDSRLVTVPTDWGWSIERTHIADAYEDVVRNGTASDDRPVFELTAGSMTPPVRATSTSAVGDCSVEMGRTAGRSQSSSTAEMFIYFIRNRMTLRSAFRRCCDAVVFAMPRSSAISWSVVPRGMSK
jgi:hypothetical protein